MKINSQAARWSSALVIITLLGACRTDEPVPPTVEPSHDTATLRINVVPEWEGAPFALFQEYRAPYDYRFQVEMLKLYLSELRLVNSAGEAPVDVVHLLDLGDGPFVIDLAVPAGSWFGLRGGLGLPYDLNHSDPALYPTGHPMSVFSGMTWNWTDGYKFMVFDGRYDPDPQSTTPLIAGFSVHPGRDTCYTAVDLIPQLPFRTVNDSTTQLTLRIAVDGFLGTAADTVDVAVENQSHGENVPLAMKIMRNVGRSMSIE
ncbi:MAG: hypothetical protein IPL52_09900 [Flavobacteriales bacterium]|nr:hypothetical protein [Flavobacteriales bacterium]